MPKRDPRKGKRKVVHWNDAFSHTGVGMTEALNDNTLVKQESPGYISKKTKKLIQVMVTTEAKDMPMDKADCDYINIPREWVIKIEPIKES